MDENAMATVRTKDWLLPMVCVSMLLAGCSGTSPSPQPSPSLPAVPFAMANDVSFAFDVPAGSLVLEVVEVAWRGPGSQDLSLNYEVELRFPPDAGSGIVYFTPWYMVFTENGDFETVDVNGDQNLADVPDGTRSLRPDFHSIDMETLGRPTLMAVLAAGTVPFNITATYHLEASYGPRHHWEYGGLEFVRSQGSRPTTAYLPNYTHETSVEADLGATPMAVFGLTMFPSTPQDPVTYNPSEAKTLVESNCGDPWRSHFSAAFSTHETLNPPTGEFHPRSRVIGESFCEKGEHGTARIEAQWLGLHEFRPFILSSPWTPLDTWVPLLSGAPTRR